MINNEQPDDWQYRLLLRGGVSTHPANASKSTAS